MFSRALEGEAVDARDAQVRTAIEAAYPRLYAYARFRVAREDAEDGVASALEHVWRSRAKFDPRRGDAGPWVYVVGLNGLRDALRRTRRGPRLVALDEADLVAPPPGPDRDRVLDALALIRGLPSADADLLAMRFGAGLTNAEIAEHTGRSVGAIATAMHRAIVRVRAAIPAESITGDRDDNR